MKKRLSQRRVNAVSRSLGREFFLFFRLSSPPNRSFIRFSAPPIRHVTVLGSTHQSYHARTSSRTAVRQWRRPSAAAGAAAAAAKSRSVGAADAAAPDAPALERFARARAAAEEEGPLGGGLASPLPQPRPQPAPPSLASDRTRRARRPGPRTGAR